MQAFSEKYVRLKTAEKVLAAMLQSCFLFVRCEVLDKDIFHVDLKRMHRGVSIYNKILGYV